MCFRAHRKIQMFFITMDSSCNSMAEMEVTKQPKWYIESTESPEAIFCAFSEYGLWNYLNYFLLQNIIEMFASDDNELKCMMEGYRKDLTGHYVLTLWIQTYLTVLYQ